ncbi:phosphoinositide 3-kinase regulatory subunit 4 isoform X2 [Iris pallida]|uniref:non-specific serine/threonine protein kinase n=1 Tax=Iris pallida TaxID=29817 RepID=A0AAX6ID50_IRIPA|nr:phosphoinositide 3-kinase regulatory subunit 4 isoform X2 [Iris pallida]
MEAVIVSALECLSMLCKSGFLRKRILLGMIKRAFLLLCYPIQWVRRATANFISASSESLGPIDSYVYLSPVLRPLLLREPCSLSSEISLLSCLKPPVSKSVFYKGLGDARSSDMLARQRKIWYNSSAYSNQLETVEHTKGTPVGERKPTKAPGSKDSNAKNGKPTGSTPKASLQDTRDVANLRVGTSFSASNSVDARDSLVSDKLQFSELILPQVSMGNSLLFDGPSEGIPLYSTCVSKRELGSLSAGLDSSLHWNSIRLSSSCMPSLDSVNKSLGLSSSVPPKLVSGSFFNISNSARLVPRSSQDPQGRENYDQPSYINSRFQELTVSDTLKGSSSITGDDVSESDVTGLPPVAGAPSVPVSGWKPRGVLVAHLQEHRSAVNELSVSNDNTFFVSASDDSTVKIWDTRKLEKDISFRSRLTYNLDGSRALCTTMLRGTAQVVVGACDGTLHLFSVDYISRGLGSVVERYSGIADIKKREAGEGAIVSLLNCSASDSCISQNVLYSTLRFGIHLWDTRTASATWNFKALPEEGHISSLVMGHCGNWFISGSSRGVLTLWDMRFLLPVNSWHYSTVSPVERMCLLMPRSNSVPVTAKPLVYVAAGCNEVSLWNADNGTCHQVLRTISSGMDAELSNFSHALTRASCKPNSKQDGKHNINTKYRTNELNEPGPRLPGICSLLPLPGGDLLTGGTDLKIRYWDHTSPNRSFSVCGPSTKGVGNDEYYDMRSSIGVQVVQEMNRRPAAPMLNQKALLAMAATDTTGCHRDAVLSLASVS